MYTIMYITVTVHTMLGGMQCYSHSRVGGFSPSFPHARSFDVVTWCFDLCILPPFLYQLPG